MKHRTATATAAALDRAPLPPTPERLAVAEAATAIAAAVTAHRAAVIRLRSAEMSEAVRGVTVTAYPYRAEAVPAWGAAQRRRRNGLRLAALMKRRRALRSALLALGWATAAALAALFLS